MPAGPSSLRCGDLVRVRGERWRIVGSVDYGSAAIVEAAGCGASNRAVRARFLLPWEPVERLPSWSAPRLVGRARWRHAARLALAGGCPSWTSLRAIARAAVDVIPFQLEPALALVRGAGCRFLLADAVGLGKTIQAALMIAETLARRPDARALVIAPAGLRDQWCDELERRFGLDPAPFDAASVARLASTLPGHVNPWAVRRVAVTSIDYIKRPETMRALEALAWDVIVFDEAHNLTGRSDRASAAALLADRARALVLLTATPHGGDEVSFARLCGLGNPGGREPLVVFRRTRADAAIPGSRRATLLHIRPTALEAAMHASLLAYVRLVWREASGGGRLVASVLARRACSSAASLARSLERRLALLHPGGAPDHVQPALPYADSDDAEPDTVLGLPGLRDPVDERVRLEAVLGLARAAARTESKLARLRRFLAQLDEPAVVFTEYRDTLLQLAAAFAHETTAELHGGLTPRERSEVLRRFTTGRARLLLATDAGSEGLNLHHRCRLVVNLEIPWTPLRLEQRAGRVDRIGQARRVHIVHLVAAGTCEDATLARLVRRLHRARGTLRAFELLPDERHVAESVLADRPLAPGPGTSPLPPGTVTLDLRAEAHAEASWIDRARQLRSHAGVIPASSRPVIARLRARSRRTMPARGIWLFRLAFVSETGDPVWEALVPLAAALPGARGAPSAVWRARLATDHPAVQRALRDAGGDRLRRLGVSLGEARNRWDARERALIDALRARHARLSAALLQRGLFDDRNDRLAGAQAAVLDEALSQSDRRLADLAACGRLRLGGCDLVFAAVLE